VVFRYENPLFVERAQPALGRRWRLLRLPKQESGRRRVDFDEFRAVPYLYSFEQAETWCGEYGYVGGVLVGRDDVLSIQRYRDCSRL
jgi:hypothetical protein